jgi:hypothetical protein
MHLKSTNWVELSRALKWEGPETNMIRFDPSLDGKTINPPADRFHRQRRRERLSERQRVVRPHHRGRQRHHLISGA